MLTDKTTAITVMMAVSVVAQKALEAADAPVAAELLYSAVAAYELSV